MKNIIFKEKETGAEREEEKRELRVKEDKILVRVIIGRKRGGIYPSPPSPSSPSSRPSHFPPRQNKRIATAVSEIL